MSTASTGTVARKLKTYITSAGFFDLAVAAPSMKAALEAWGAESNLFHQGFAKQTEDKAVIAATMAKPGVVLRRPVGTDAAFGEHAALPTHLGSGEAARAAPKRRTKPHKPTEPIDGKTAREAASAFDREQKQRDRQALREEAARKKDRERRDRTIAAAEAAFREGKRIHQANLADLEKAQQALDKRKEAEAARWGKQEERLERTLRKAKSAGHLRVVVVGAAVGIASPDATLACFPSWPTREPLICWERGSPEPLFLRIVASHERLWRAALPAGNVVPPRTYPQPLPSRGATIL